LHRVLNAALPSLLVIVCALLAPLPGQAADAGAAAWRAMDILELAERLTDQGLARDDALALIVAARMKLRYGGREVDRQPLRPSGRAMAVTVALPRPAPHPRSATALLARARTLAAGRADLLALIDDAAQERARGNDDGPSQHTRVSVGHTTDTYRLRFRVGEPATVLISGDGGTNLDLYVFDGRGARVCAAEKLDDVEVCRWQPAANGDFTVQIVNRGRAENAYVMRSN
jgi:hypothetical protein